jgi:hypothetical protein
MGNRIKAAKAAIGSKLMDPAGYHRLASEAADRCQPTASQFWNSKNSSELTKRQALPSEC